MRLLSGLCFILINKRIHELDKSHVKTYANSWIDIWKNNPTPLSDLRINEAWKGIIWCTENKYRNKAHCLSYKHNNFLIFIYDNDKENELEIRGFIESPDNIYNPNQIKNIHNDLTEIAERNNYTLEYSFMKNWSHGFHFYEYQ
jgi:uncharacterized protein YdeI (YjbR/CyaY-like superfamily)|tara:strand:+ start:50 stop:481 length:432 start_codon:yes stop_codon:yes gene_type:complete